MPEPKEERIMRALDAQLALISVANGFANDIASTQRFEMGGNDFVDAPLIILQLGEVTHLKRVQPNEVWEVATILVAVYARHDKSIDARSTDAILISLDADIYRAVMGDLKLGGLTIDLSRTSVFPDDIEKPVAHVGHVSEFSATFTHLIDSVEN